VVVNCAGRTRSIIGCQSLRNAGIPNRVVALKDGTMGWDLAGFECERGATRVAPARPRRERRSAGRGRAGRAALRGQVHRPASSTRGAKDREPNPVSARRAHAGGVRARPRRRLAARSGRAARAGERRVRRGAQRARRPRRPGAGARGDDRVVARADGMERGLRPRRCARLAMETGPRRPPEVAKWALRSVECCQERVSGSFTSLRFHHAHIPGAWWAVRSRLDEARGKIGVVVLARGDFGGWAACAPCGAGRSGAVAAGDSHGARGRKRGVDRRRRPTEAASSARPPSATTSGTSPTTTVGLQL
jgi:hypothetical protein